MGEKPKGPSRTSMWSNLHSQDGSMEYLSSKNKSMHCRGDAAGRGELANRRGRRRRRGARGSGSEWEIKRRGGKKSLTFYNVDTFPLRGVFLRVVGWGEIPSIGLLQPGPTLPSWGHTWIVLHWKRARSENTERQGDGSVKEDESAGEWLSEGRQHADLSVHPISLVTWLMLEDEGFGSDIKYSDCQSYRGFILNYDRNLWCYYHGMLQSAAT